MADTQSADRGQSTDPGKRPEESPERSQSQPPAAAGAPEAPIQTDDNVPADYWPGMPDYAPSARRDTRRTLRAVPHQPDASRSDVPPAPAGSQSQPGIPAAPQSTQSAAPDAGTTGQTAAPYMRDASANATPGQALEPARTSSPAAQKPGESDTLPPMSSVPAAPERPVSRQAELPPGYRPPVEPPVQGSAAEWGALPPAAKLAAPGRAAPRSYPAQAPRIGTGPARPQVPTNPSASRVVPPAARPAGKQDPVPQNRAALAYSSRAPGARAVAPGRVPPKRQTRPRRRLGCGGVLGIGLLALALALLVFGGLLFGYVGIASALPSPEDLQARASQFASTQIYDRQGQILNEIADPSHGRRTVVPLDQISKNLQNATIATEDPNFYQHQGVDPTGLARAVYYAVRNRDISAGPGGSTITQQLVKLVYLSSERSMTRKIKEAVLAAEITRRYDKPTVLQIYLNEIYYGNLAYGIEAAAETYFGKHAKDLDLAEASMLAGLPQAPAYYDPYTKLWAADGQPGLVKQRQGVVLGLMVRHGYITAEQADAAWKEQLKLKPLQQSYAMKSPHFVYYVRDDVEKVLGPALLAKGGLKIYTTLDSNLQSAAEQEVAAQVRKLSAQKAGDGALVAVRPATGEILAMVGSADFNNDKISGQINMAVVPRQPGSSIKPLTYLTAFSMAPAKIDDKTQPSDAVSALEPAGYWTPGTAVLDIKTEFPDGNGRPPYVPGNYDGKEHGVVSVRTALANSYNIPAVKALEHVGIEKLKDTAARMGITTLTRPDYGLSLTLGGGEVSLLELTGAYATMANGGSRVPVSPIACIVDASGQAIWVGNGAEQVQPCKSIKPAPALLVSPQPAQPVVDPQATYLVTSILSDLEARRPAYGNSAELLGLPDRPAAAKTGTTNDNRDGWTMGYTPDLAVGVWFGNADYSPMKGIAGSVGAAPVWHNVMTKALAGTAPKQFTVPPGIVRMKVCADTGTLPSDACPKQREEVFAAGRGPLPARFDLHQRLRYDKATGQLATDFTPADRIETKDVMVFPPRYQAWAEAHGHPQPNMDLHKYAFAPELTINSPAQNSQVSGVVQVNGRLHLPDPLVWRLEYGVGPSPIGWGVVNGPQRGDVDGGLGDWDSARMVDKHHETGFSLRVSAYDPANLDYPVAISNVIYVTVERPTAEPSATPQPAPTRVPTATRTPTALPTLETVPTDTPVAQPTDLPAETPAPTSGPAPTATAQATAGPTEPTATATVSAAAGVQAQINEPAAGAIVSGPVAVLGVAAGPGLASYQVDFAHGAQPAPDTWQPIQPPLAQPSTARGGLLGIWHTATLEPGTYSVRLTVTDTSGTAHFSTVVVEVTGP